MDGMGNLTFLDPGTLVFNATQGSTVIDPDGRRLVQFTSHTELWDNYNHLFLRDMTEQIVDTAHYTTDYGEDMALVRGSNAADAWTPAPWKTPGQPEPGSTPSSTTVLFSEILPDAVGSDSQSWPSGEWIELYNFGTMDVDVADKRPIVAAEPPFYSLHLWRSGALVSHFQPVGHWQTLARFEDHLKPMMKGLFAERS